MNLTYETIAAFKKGDMSAFEHLYHQYVGRVYNYILSMLRDAVVAEDLTHNLFVHLWEKRENIDPAGNLNSYIYTVARNMVYHHVKKKLFVENYHHTLFKQGGEIGDMQIENRLDEQLIEKQIMELAADLPPSRREIFMMRWQQGLSNKEIAERLVISEKTVSTQIHRSMIYLREKLEKVFPGLAIIFFTTFPIF
jgi:RNA polymerase sigma-70 factor (ECF subfamily)